MRALRLILLVMMLAFLPLPGWAAALAHAVVSTTAAAGVPGAAIVDADVDVDVADAAGAHQAAVTGEPANDPLPLPEAAEPQWQPGADLAEQLLPATPPRLAPWSGRAGPPRYAGALLPEPDLPRLPRPPRA
ncbi:hypothetical protein [Cupriavidus taiwanensis]|uniref:Uncharacterized protein n=1 Tax=Cupriavidus taiwanensis TaxID=164546 RepID=A0A7Z7NKK2_9BURK|nr:hypothetical protein [Cupriavidus taiwanensis]SOY90165.1 conserved hypothetical protein; putative exported protein [Cupriavidus taiwanensis]SOZ00567.1 conserved hypothetical protein; putative exported protein [Cupriavidus taiwanensis]SOZ03662.1 conserved hypothetical protein; putative exported protein [Cupriavidus taiwanensis]SPC07898.1 conserved hypothetical protein; putative exported protein [Cupriavidus taiwanensis]SPD42278.1 conserved exported protein of unknown function [Cupriavidus ta